MKTVTSTQYADGRVDIHAIEDHEHMAIETFKFERAGIEFEVAIFDHDGETHVHVAFTQGGETIEERFGGYAARAVILSEVRGYCREIACPTERARYGTPEWEIEVEGEMIRAEEEEARYGC
jgi:hypothetical protein